MAKTQKQILAVKVTRETTIGRPTGGSFEATKGTVLVVPHDISAEDASYLCAMGKAVGCGPDEKSKAKK